MKAYAIDLRLTNEERQLYDGTFFFKGMHPEFTFDDVEDKEFISDTDLNIIEFAIKECELVIQRRARELASEARQVEMHEKSLKMMELQNRMLEIDLERIQKEAALIPLREAVMVEQVIRLRTQNSNKAELSVVSAIKDEFNQCAF